MEEHSVNLTEKERLTLLALVNESTFKGKMAEAVVTLKKKLEAKEECQNCS